MPRTHKLHAAIAFSAVIAAFGVAAGAQARLIGDPPVNAKRTQPVRKATKPLRSTRYDGGFTSLSGQHVYSGAEAKTE